MDENKLSLKRVLTNFVIILSFALIVVLGIIRVFNVKFEGGGTQFYIYIFLVSAIVIGIASFFIYKVCKIYSDNKKLKYINIAIITLCSLIIIFMTIYFANSESPDYVIFLDVWTEEYSKLSFKDCLYSIINISNYNAFYNYFLIIIAKLGLNSLYSIKFITFIFTLLLALAVTLIIKTIKNEKFSYALFMIFMIVPYILVEYAEWGQCDAIYTSFAFLSFYFALNKKSKLSFLFIGLAFVTKMQFLFMVPILFVMLIIKDENGEHYLKWKDIWIAPLCYVINLVPVLAGRPLIDMLKVYLMQAKFDNRITGNCPNVCMFLSILSQDIWTVNTFAYKLTSVLCVIFTFALLIVLLIIIFRYNKRKVLTKYDLTFFGTVFSFIMVLFMPKMLDRFYYIATTFSIILMIISFNKRDIIISNFLNISLTGAMMIFLFNWAGNQFVYNSCFMTLTFLNFIVFILMSVKIFKNYIVKKNFVDEKLKV